MKKKFIHWTESSHSLSEWLSSDKALVISKSTDYGSGSAIHHLDMLTLCSSLYISVTLFNPCDFWKN